jgi:hypothetical protein
MHVALAFLHAEIGFHAPHADTLAAKAAELLDEATKIEAAALDAQPLEGD